MSKKKHAKKNNTKTIIVVVALLLLALIGYQAAREKPQIDLEKEYPIFGPPGVETAQVSPIGRVTIPNTAHNLDVFAGKKVVTLTHVQDVNPIQETIDFKVDVERGTEKDSGWIWNKAFRLDPNTNTWIEFELLPEDPTEPLMGGGWIKHKATYADEIPLKTITLATGVGKEGVDANTVLTFSCHKTSIKYRSPKQWKCGCETKDAYEGKCMKWMKTDFTIESLTPKIALSELAEARTEVPTAVCKVPTGGKITNDNKLEVCASSALGDWSNAPLEFSLTQQERITATLSADGTELTCEASCDIEHANWLNKCYDLSTNELPVGDVPIVQEGYTIEPQKKCPMQEKPDFVVTKVVAFPRVAARNEPVTIRTEAYNFGTKEHKNQLRLEMYTIGTDDREKLLAEKIFDFTEKPFRPGELLVWEETFNDGTGELLEGEHKINVVIDPLDEVYEFSEENNMRYDPLKVKIGLKPELRIRKITFTPTDINGNPTGTYPKTGDYIQFQAEIANEGTADAPAFKVNWYTTPKDIPLTDLALKELTLIPSALRTTGILQWSPHGALPRMNCINVNEPSDTHKTDPVDRCWDDVIGYKRVCTHKNWRGRCDRHENRPIINRRCVRDEDPSGWEDNYLCTHKDIGLRWSQAGPIQNMQCERVYEDADNQGWNDNYLCSPTNELGLKWSQAGPIKGMHCLNINEPGENKYQTQWRDNFLCEQELKTNVDALPMNQKTIITARYKYEEEGNYEVKLVVDPENKVPEFFDNDNEAMTSLSTIKQADIAVRMIEVLDGAGQPLTRMPRAEEPLKFKATLENLGTLPTGAFTVRFEVQSEKEDPDGTITPELLTEEANIKLDPKQVITLETTIDINYPRGGQFEVSVRADPNWQIPEFRKENNELRHLLEVEDKPDLTITNIRKLTHHPVINEDFEVEVEITNKGSEKVDKNVPVKLELVDTNGNLITTSTPSEDLNIEPTGVQTVLFKLKQDKVGIYTLKATADPVTNTREPNGLVNEFDENNNEHKTKITLLVKPVTAYLFSCTQAKKGTTLKPQSLITLTENEGLDGTCSPNGRAGYLYPVTDGIPIMTKLYEYKCGEFKIHHTSVALGGYSIQGCTKEREVGHVFPGTPYPPPSPGVVSVTPPPVDAIGLHNVRCKDAGGNTLFAYTATKEIGTAGEPQIPELTMKCKELKGTTETIDAQAFGYLYKKSPLPLEMPTVDYATKTLVFSGTINAELNCPADKVVCGGQHVTGIGTDDIRVKSLFCCDVKKYLPAFVLNAGTLNPFTALSQEKMCAANEVVCGGKNVVDKTTVGQIKCCPTTGVQIGQARTVDTTGVPGGFVFCKENEVACGGKSGTAAGNVLDQLRCCAIK